MTTEPMSDNEYRTLVEECPDGIVVHHDGVVRYVNRAAAALIGLPDPAVMIGTIVWDYVAPAERAIVLQRAAALAERDEMPTPRLTVWLKPDGTPVDLEARASKIVFGGQHCLEVVLRDAEARRRADLALQESEARYRLLADHTRDLISIRTAEHRFVWLSPSYETELGWAPDELVGTDAVRLLHPDDRGRVDEVSAQLRSGEPPSPVVVRMRHTNGSFVWHESVVTALPAREGEAPRYIASARNIEDRLKMEVELRDAQKVEALARMASGVAHDTNNILTIIRSAAESLIHASADSADREEAIGAILESVDRAASLTAQLLSFSRRQHAALEEVPLQQLCDALCPMLGRVAAPSAEVYVEFATSADGALVRADRAQFGQMLVQLVANARDAMETGGRVSIRTGTQQLHRAMRTRTGTIAAGLYATIDVMDHGRGMSAEVMRHLFEPFFTTKLQGEGSGLGLATVFGIVKQNGGGLSVESTPGSGSTFRVYWPATGVEVTASEPLLPALRRLADDEATARGERAAPSILLIDDEPFILRLTGRVLERLGCHVITAANGAEGLALASAPRAALDAIVTDVRMPGMSGPDMVRSLIAAGVDLPVLFISGQLDAPIPMDYPDTVPRRFLSKPVKSAEMARALVELGLFAEEPGVR